MAPSLFDAEVANALWKHLRAGDISRNQALGARRETAALVDIRLEIQTLAEDALATAAAFDHPVYDALYAVAARRTGATVCTLDRRLIDLLAAMRVPNTSIVG